ncbi:MAG TPA: helix-turn-helix transcriptional regulator [Pyrinomonadaceae bacterium]|nr:helix-turn-helix transcriptional regulator [Pyrinomonadaceae bacterium]
MGRSTNLRPARLAEKLLQIRLALELSQNQMIRRLGLPENFLQGSISGYELGTRVPPLNVLRAYAEAAGVWMDVLVNDDVDIPEKLPCKPKSEGVKRRKGR